MNLRFVSFPLVAFCLFASISLAVEKAGAEKAVAEKPGADKPAELNLKTIDGQPLTSRHLKGKVVVLEFWATWCPPCMKEMPHMKQVNATYGKKGVQIIGVSFDSSVAEQKSVIAAQGLDWMHVNDANREVGKQFGVEQTANVVVLGPDMMVRWKGLVFDLDAALADVMRKYPPQLADPKVVKAAQATLAEVDKKLAAGDAKGALKWMSRVPDEASRDLQFAKAADETRTKLDAAAVSLLQSAEDDAAAGKYKEAAGQLRDLSVSLAGLAVGDQAKAKLDELMTKPEAKGAIESAEKEAKASAALDEAAKHRTAKRHEAAYPAYKDVAKTYPDTPSGAEAAAIVKKYESDAAFMKRLNETQAGGKAKAALSLASGYAKAGKRDLAAKKYQSVIKDFPGTSYAKTAKEELAKLK